MIERNSRLAIAGSLIWIVIATFSMLGTHGGVDAAAAFDDAQAEVEVMRSPATAEAASLHVPELGEC